MDQLQNIFSIDKVEEMMNKNKKSDSMKFLTALEAGKEILDKNGGKLIVFNASLSWTTDKRMNIDNIFKNLGNSPKNEYIYTSLDFNKYLSEFGRSLTKSLISCDILQIDPPKNQKISTLNKNEKVSFDVYNNINLNEICSNCNGNLYYFNDFNTERDYKSIFNTVKRIITRNTGWEAMCKIRLSKDYEVKELYTPVLCSNLDLLILPQVDR